MVNENENMKEKELNKRLKQLQRAKIRIQKRDGISEESKQKRINEYEKEEQSIKEGYESWIEYKQIREEKMLDLEEKIFPRKQITVKLYPETHKALKIKAASGNRSLERMVSSIVEDKLYHLDIAKYVKEDFEEYDEFEQDVLGLSNTEEIYEIGKYNELYERDINRNYYDELFKENPRKRINVKVYQQTHRKLKIISVLQNRSLNDIVSTIIEDEVGGNDIDFDKKLMN